MVFDQMSIEGEASQIYATAPPIEPSIPHSNLLLEWIRIKRLFRNLAKKQIVFQIPMADQYHIFHARKQIIHFVTKNNPLPHQQSKSK